MLNAGTVECNIKVVLFDIQIFTVSIFKVTVYCQNRVKLSQRFFLLICVLKFRKVDVQKAKQNKI